LVLLEGGVVGVIAAKIYEVSPATLAVISAAPMFANLSSFLWNVLATARPKVAFANLVQIGTIVCVLAVALAPVNEMGAFVLVASMIASRILVAGLVTVRSVVWSLNYERSTRAQATGRLQMIASLVTVVISSAVGPLLDAHPGSFTWVYLGGVAVGLVGVFFFSRVKVVGELRQRVIERQAHRGQAGSVGFLAIIREDGNFRRYQVSMFTAGFANMLIEAPLVYLITREMAASYTVSIMLTMVIPFAVSLIALPIWAQYLDRVHVAQFRARQAILWIVAQLFTLVGALLGSVAWLAVGRFVMGIARGGGSLAWQLGHNDFAKPDQLSAYMGIHVTLTGLRGAIAPFLGMFLYVGWDRIGWAGLSGWVFLVAAVLSAASGLGFYRLYRRMKRANLIHV
jgi:MFS family permease